MGNIAIRVEGLGKMYRIGGRQERYRTLRDTLADAFAAPFRRASSLLRGQAYGAAGLNETIWALKDVSFEVKHGEVVGIIGRNGAGKSTLLKILSRITEPTEGYADVYGRVGSLLEVGTGFHPELTGRENIYLNGAILGMSREEIDRKFDEIVDFAEIEKFIDTPVKHYSSGMGLRLGFAVAAHLEPEILVVDEVLAVGDAQFQKKCLGKMSEVAGEGRTVLFVSHNMGAVRSLCTAGVLLREGSLETLGEIGKVIYCYTLSFDQDELRDSESGGDLTFTNMRINGRKQRFVDMTAPFELKINMRVARTIPRGALYCIIRNSEDSTVLHSRVDSKAIMHEIRPGNYELCLEFPSLWLRPGMYTAQFKMIARTAVAKGRFVSDPMIIEVGGNSDPGVMPGTLTPSIPWTITSRG